MVDDDIKATERQLKELYENIEHMRTYIESDKYRFSWPIKEQWDQLQEMRKRKEQELDYLYKLKKRKEMKTAVEDLLDVEDKINPWNGPPSHYSKLQEDLAEIALKREIRERMKTRAKEKIETMEKHEEKEKLTTNNKGNNTMELNNMFNGMFGKAKKGQFAVALAGGIAVKTGKKGFKTYDIKTKKLTNVENFCFENENFFYIVPTNKPTVGDIILVDDAPKCVIAVDVDNETVKVIDYEKSEVCEIKPEHFPFMGNTYFYGKVMCPFAKGGKMFKAMMAMQMMGDMFGGNKNAQTENTGFAGMFGGGNNMFQTMFAMKMMNSMFNGKDDAADPFDFENLFDFNFDVDEDKKK